jgi:2-polyprenyl-3-methyl-5-hydroxy-6-metoxy-1,4-benzoquinol methylase
MMGSTPMRNSGVIVCRNSAVGRLGQNVYGAENRTLLPLIPKGASRFLDVGCGTGALMQAIQCERAGAQLEGITFSDEEAQRARKHMRRVWLDDLNHFDFGQLGVFDCIVCSHVLEHLTHPAEVLQELRSHLDRNGALLVAIPNALELKTRLAFLMGRFRYADSGILDRTHYRFFDWQTAYELVRDAGFDVDVRVATGFCPLPGVRRLIGRAAAKLDDAAARYFPGLLGVQFILRGRIRNS